MFGAMAASALDLPTKRVKGVEYYYYKVKKGESLYGISKNIGLPVDEIVSRNPGAADGVRKGDLLLFPKADYAEAPLPAPEVEDNSLTEPAEVEAPELVRRPSLAVMLPFGLNKSERSKQNNLAIDFYKGVLIAADSLADRPGRFEIVARDTEGLSPEALRNLINTDSALMCASVIVAPDDEASLHAVAEAATAHGAFVLNTLNIRDSLYQSNPLVLQANVPQAAMFRLAVDAVETSFAGFTPVILRNNDGRNDKEAFTEYLTGRMRQRGVEPIVITYSSNLLMANLEELPTDAGQRYLFVPSSGSLAEFNRFAYVLKSYRDLLNARAAEADPELPAARAEVFGYPDWTAFRGDALDLLHRLDATVYSRFLDDFDGFSTRTIASDFKRWYGTTMTESIPTYGLLGYDTACFVIKNLRANSGSFDPLSPRSYEGIQSAFDFDRSGEGYVNNTLYIINYQPGGHIASRLQ